MSQPLREKPSSVSKSSRKGLSKVKKLHALSPSATVRNDNGLTKSVVPSDLRTTVRIVSRLYKLGDFGDSTLKSTLTQLMDHCKSSDQASSSDYWKARNLLYELNEILDLNSQISDQAFRDGQSLYQQLKTLAHKHKRTPFMFSERRLLREQALFVGCYAHEIQRRSEKSDAREAFEWLLDFVRRFVKTEEFPCYGTQALFCYHIGTILRKMELHRQAETMFSEALNLLHKRAKYRESKEKPYDLGDYLFDIRKQAMIIGLGFGLINMSRGDLERAEHALTTARSLLGQSKDPLIPAYIELQCGALKRCQAGSSRRKLEKAISQLEAARKALNAHTRHRVRACWELALAKTLYGNLSEARKDLQQVERFAEQKADHKWRTNVHILQSRMLRKEGKYIEALGEAERAIETARSRDCNSVLALVDALITRGEAHLNLVRGPIPDVSECDLAKADFKNAFKLISRQEPGRKEGEVYANPKIVAVCKLRLAQTYAREGDQVAAQALYDEWQRLDSQVEHEWVRELAIIVKDEISRLSRNFSISAVNEKAWNYSENIERLRRWLAWRALGYAKQNYSEAARLIGVQRATLYQWVAETSGDVKRRGRRPNFSNGNGED